MADNFRREGRPLVFSSKTLFFGVSHCQLVSAVQVEVWLLVACCDLVPSLGTLQGQCDSLNSPSTEESPRVSLSTSSVGVEVYGPNSQEEMRLILTLRENSIFCVTPPRSFSSPLPFWESGVSAPLFIHWTSVQFGQPRESTSKNPHPLEGEIQAGH